MLAAVTHNSHPEVYSDEKSCEDYIPYMIEPRKQFKSDQEIEDTFRMFAKLHNQALDNVG